MFSFATPENVTIVGNLRAVTQEGEKETRQMTHFFICFSSPNCLGNSFFSFENYLNSFS